MDTIRPLPAVVLRQALQQVAAGDKVLAISGAQGCGKSTLARQLKVVLAQHQISAEVVSLDDYYLSQAERRRLSQQVHPLLQTRGVPGTHHIEQLAQDLTQQWAGAAITLPVFDKATDDALAKRPPWRGDVLLVEGWCLGLLPLTEAQLLAAPNALEAIQDAELRWRHWVNQQLAVRYQQVWPLLGSMILLQAPGWQQICRWRAAAEQELINKQGRGMSDETLSAFMQHYQRWSAALLSGQHRPAALTCYLDDTQQFYHFASES